MDGVNVKGILSFSCDHLCDAQISDFIAMAIDALQLTYLQFIIHDFTVVALFTNFFNEIQRVVCQILANCPEMMLLLLGQVLAKDGLARRTNRH